MFVLKNYFNSFVFEQSIFLARKYQRAAALGCGDFYLVLIHLDPDLAAANRHDTLDLSKSSEMRLNCEGLVASAQRVVAVFRLKTLLRRDILDIKRQFVDDLYLVDEILILDAYVVIVVAESEDVQSREL